MKLRTRIFVVSFSVSVALLGGAAIALTAIPSRNATTSGGDASLERLQSSVDELAALATAAAEGRAVEAAALQTALVPLRKDLVRRAVLERDVAIETTAGWIVLLAAEALAALAVSAVAAAALTARWSRLRDGILRLRRGGPRETFFSGTRDEFGAVEEELDRLVEALGDRERMRSELRALQGWGEASAFLAHQARTPLSSLMLSARTARAALEAFPTEQNPGGNINATALDEARSSLERAEAEAARIAALFSRVRSLSGFKDPVLTDVDPALALREAAAALAARGLPLGAEQVSIEAHGTGARPRFDHGYLVEVFSNLLSNSMEACAERGLPFSVRLSLTAEAADYTIEYSDSVTGLDPALVDRVGTARFTTKPEGAGLGVWLVGRVAALHGGRLETGLTAAGGLRFTMIFPAGGVS